MGTLIANWFYARRVAVALAVVMGAASTVFGQMESLTVEPASPVEQKLVEAIMKVVLPFLWGIVAPWLSGMMLSGVKIVPPGLQHTLSGLLGGGIGALAGMLPDVPLHVDSGAEMGASTAVVGQITANMHRTTLSPKTVSPTPKE